MKLGLFNGGRLGLICGDVVRDISSLLTASAGEAGKIDAVIRSKFLETSEISLDDPELANLPTLPLGDVHWEAPLPKPGKIIGAPANYYEHIAEMVGSKSIMEYGLFLKANTSIIGPGQAVELPYDDLRTDHEAELAVVIGKGGRHIPVEMAYEHVFGYTCVLDITVRSTEDRSTRKSYDTFTPLGPYIVTSDEIEDPGRLELTLSINGEQRQASSTDKLIYGIPELIAYASSVMTLEPGDVIATGTPEGVGPIADGDMVTMTVQDVGTLSVGVTSDMAVPYATRPGPSSVTMR